MLPTKGRNNILVTLICIFLENFLHHLKLNSKFDAFQTIFVEF